jgi:hypothetical protein
LGDGEEDGDDGGGWEWHNIYSNILTQRLEIV